MGKTMSGRCMHEGPEDTAPQVLPSESVDRIVGKLRELLESCDYLTQGKYVEELFR